MGTEPFPPVPPQPPQPEPVPPTPPGPPGPPPPDPNPPFPPPAPTYAERTPIAAVTEGMSVVDSAGKHVGSVAMVQMGDGGAVDEDLFNVAERIAGPEPRVPEEAAQRLLRTGYVKVKSKGFLSPDRYAAADDIDDVANDTVNLKVPVNQLIAKG